MEILARRTRISIQISSSRMPNMGGPRQVFFDTPQGPNHGNTNSVFFLPTPKDPNRNGPKRGQGRCNKTQKNNNKSKSSHTEEAQERPTRGGPEKAVGQTKVCEGRASVARGGVLACWLKGEGGGPSCRACFAELSRCVGVGPGRSHAI